MREVVVRWSPAVDPSIDAHLLLRRAVGELRGCPSAAVVVSHRCDVCGGEHGRPSVEIDGRRGPHVSIARGGALVVVAVAAEPVGVDVERLERGSDTAELTTWVRTEAVLKATGLGLTVDPSSVGLDVRGDEPRLVGWDGPGRRPVMRIADVATEAGHLVSVARLGRRRLRVDARVLELSPTS
jgi:4'-phosphopantetheinyl transferase